MNKLFFTLIILVVQSFSYAYAQIDTFNAKYFDELIEELSSDENIKEIKRINKKILLGEYYLQSVYVKFENDRTGKYWLIGKQFTYYTKNNQLAIFREVNLETAVLSDTTFYYNDDGTIARLRIFPEYFDNYIPVKTGPANWSGIKGYFERYPNQYKTINFIKKSTVAEEYTYKYSSDKGFVIKDQKVQPINSLGERLMENESENTDELIENSDLDLHYFVDKRDGKKYNTVVIDSTKWMAENLKFEPDSGKFWYFRNDPRTVGDLGILYTWETSLNVCPSGWRIPSKEDYQNLINYLSQSSTNVYSELIPEGSSGLNISKAGVKYGTSFIIIENGGTFWSSTESKRKSVWGFSVDEKSKSAMIYPTFNKKSGIPVRCLKNED